MEWKTKKERERNYDGIGGSAQSGCARTMGDV